MVSREPSGGPGGGGGPRHEPSAPLCCRAAADRDGASLAEPVPVLFRGFDQQRSTGLGCFGAIFSSATALRSQGVGLLVFESYFTAKVREPAGHESPLQLAFSQPSAGCRPRSLAWH